MKTKPSIIIAGLFVFFLISIDALGLTADQLEANIRAVTTGCPDFTVTAPTESVTINASTYGVATGNSGAVNYTDFQNAIAACKSQGACKLIVNPGTYKVGNYAAGSYGNGIFYFDHMTNFMFDGQGSTFLCQNKSMFFNVKYCSKVAFQNYTIGWDWSQEYPQSLAQVTNVTSTYIDLYYPYETNPDTNALVYEMDEAKKVGSEYQFSHDASGILGQSKFNVPATKLATSKLRYTTTANESSKVVVGQWFIIRHYEYDHKGNNVEYCNNVTYSNVTVYSTLGMGFSMPYNKYVQIIDSKLIREPGTIYHLSSAADGINTSPESYGYLKLQNDEIGNAGDDSINIHDDISEGLKVLSTTSLLASNCISWRNPYDVGDTVELRKGDYTPWNWSAALTAVSSYSNNDTIKLTFGSSLPAGLTSSSIIFNHEYDSGNYIISGCNIHNNKGKGAFVHNSNGTIEDNIFTNNYNPGLFMASIYSVYGSGSVYGEGYNPSNILVLNNYFDGNNIIRNNGVTDTYFPNDIVIIGQTGPQAIASYPICQDIIFEYNTVKNSTHASMEIGSATNILVKNNAFENPCLTNGVTPLDCIIVTNTSYLVFSNNSMIVDPGVTSYSTNIYVATLATNNVFVFPFGSVSGGSGGGETNLSSPWMGQDIGSVGVPGSASISNGIYTVNGSGSDIWSTSDSFQYVYQPWSGDGQIVARVTSVENTSSSAKAALMFRETLDADSRNTTLFQSPTHISLQGRTVIGGSTSTAGTTNVTAPQWLALVRLGATISGYQSVDGVNWTLVGIQTNFTTTNIYVGLAVTSKSNSVTCTATYDHVTVNGAWLNGDIGSVGVSGSSQINYSNGVVTVAGSGTDIWSTNDSFQYLYQSCSGDRAIMAQVTGVQNTSSSAKAALMIRETTGADSRNTTLLLEPTNGVAMQGRTNTGGSSYSVNHVYSLLPPQWLMLVRSSANMNGYQSVDGTNWSWIGTQTNGIASSYYIGLAVSSKNNTVLNTSTFDNVSVRSAWESGDIGNVGIAGSAAVDDSTGTFVVSGSGSDIWGTADAFQYVDQPLYGNGQIVARVTSIGAPSSDKAGVMVRDTLSANSINALMFISTNGISFQGRTSTGGSSSTFYHTGGLNVPYWLELSRNGSSLTAYYSSDGTSWTLMGTQTVSMSTDAWIGLAVSSKNNAILDTATFDNVTVTPAP